MRKLLTALALLFITLTGYSQHTYWTDVHTNRIHTLDSTVVEIVDSLALSKVGVGVSDTVLIIIDGTIYKKYLAGGGDMTKAVYDTDANDHVDDAEQWTTTRSVTFATGDVTGSFNIDGSGNVSNIDLQVGDDTHKHTYLPIPVRKASAGTILKGVPVYIVAWNVGGWNTVEEADASDPAKMPSVGLAGEDLTNSATGDLYVVGQLRDWNTTAYSIMDDLYVASGGGYPVNTKPTGTNEIQKIAQVTRVNITNGAVEIFGAGRANDIPNIADNYFWLGNVSGVATPIEFDTEVSANPLVASALQWGDTTGSPRISTGYDVDTLTNRMISDIIQSTVEVPYYHFDGVDDVITITDNTLLSITKDFSVSFNIIGYDYTDLGVIFCSSDGGSDRFVAQFRNGTIQTSAYNGAATVRRGSVSLTEGQVYNVTLTFSVDPTFANSDLEMYINGVLQSDVTGASVLPSVGSLYLGVGASANYGNMDLYNFNIYNKALTASEIADLTNNPDNTEWLNVEAGATDVSTFDSDLDSWAISSGDEVSTWTWVTDHANLAVTGVGTITNKPRIIKDLLISLTDGKDIKITFDYTVNSGTCVLPAVALGGVVYDPNETLTGSGTYDSVFTMGTINDQMILYFNGTNLFNVDIDNITFTQLGEVLHLSGDKSPTVWYDKSGNANDGTVTGAELTLPDKHLFVDGEVEATTLSTTSDATIGGDIYLGISQKLILDMDQDSDIEATGDDVIEVSTGGVTRLEINNTGIEVTGTLETTGNAIIGGSIRLGINQPILLDDDINSYITATQDDYIGVFVGASLNTYFRTNDLLFYKNPRPNADNTVDNGASTARWKIGYFKAIDLDGNITVGGTVDGIDIGTDVPANTTHRGLTSGNPHSVTKAEVSLTNVTDDSQLKRSANDFNTFAYKSALVSGDILIIEDSEGSGAKKYTTIGDLPTGGGGEANTASSIGAGSSLTPGTKSGVDIEFYGIKSENALLSVAIDGVSYDIELTVNEGSIDHNNLSNTHNLNTDLDFTGLSTSGIATADEIPFYLSATGNRKITFGNFEGTLSHNNLADYAIGQHRIINDAGTSTTELWSSDKINTDLGTKEATLTKGDFTETITGLELSATREVIGGALTLDLTSGYVIPTTTQETNWGSAYTHISESGASHTYISQDVTSTGTPTFGSATITAGITLGTSLSVDDTPASGVATYPVTKTAGNAVVLGDLVYYKSDSKLWDADADASGTTQNLYIALATISADATGSFAKAGSYVTNSGWSWTAGDLLYVSETASAITATRPSTVGTFVVIVGMAESATTIHFTPKLGWVKN